MTDQQDNTLCRQVDDAMVDLLAGNGPEQLHDHLASCDRCRDARHDAERAVALVADSAADYEHPEDFDARVESALDARADDDGASSADADQADADQADAAQPDADQADADQADADQADADQGEAATEREPAAKTQPMAAVDAPDVLQASGAGARQRGGDVTSISDWLRRPRNTVGAGLLGAAAVAAVIAVVFRPQPSPVEQATIEGWKGKVSKVSRAAGGSGGLQACDDAGEGCRPVEAGADIAAGSLLKTDDRTRAYVELSDGTRLALDRSTQLSFAQGMTRTASLNHGAIVAEVASVQGSKATFALPKGKVEVVGTKLALRLMGQAAAVDVSRGSVLLVDEQDRSVKVRAGEEGRVYPGVPPYATSAPSLSESLSWSETVQDEEIAVRGLGELKAKKPGEDDERQGAVRLTSHKVKVRIVDGFARTEVTEVFTNTTDEVLEGIYRFPMPPDAQIERLALEVDGVMEEGAFVDRDRAAAIWRGAIVNAQQRRPRRREEIVWVPGPWKDPALLEWQRGGRFELRVFPIPRKGSRRVILTYTQVLNSAAGTRRYVYPLAHDPSGNLRVDQFDVDIQARGHDLERGLSSQGYALTQSDRGAAQSLTMNASSFVPSGDLVVEYAAADRHSELSAWAYRPATRDEQADEEAGGAAAKPSTGKSDDAKARALAAVADGRPYVAMTLRPKLPRWSEDAQRAYVFVVDASRSMYGARFRRAGSLVSRVVSELERLDRFTVMACDTTCRVMPGGLRTPSNAAATEVKQFLDTMSPEGGSDPAASIRQAGAVASKAEGRALRVVYVGDGTPTVGPIRPSYVTQAVRDAIPGGQATLTAVAIGADADVDTLAAMARGGGGTVLPYVPGQRVSEAAYAVLGASYGMGLRDVRVELPSGMVEVAPRQLDTIAAGSEAVVVARMTQPHVNGTVVLRGQVGDKPFEQRYPVDVSATGDAGNAFVPRLYAAARIGDLERDGSAAAREEAVALSGAFNVASRFTSLLVLESAAMFRAFGLDNERRVAEWTGEDDALGVASKGEDRCAAGGEGEFSADEAGQAIAGIGTGGGGFGFGHGAKKSKAPTGAVPPMAPPPASRPVAKPRPTPQPRPGLSPNDLLGRRSPPRRRGLVPMRKIYERQSTIHTERLIPLVAAADKIADAERELAANDNRRGALKKLYTLLALAGEVDKASTLVERWSEKEALDPEALTARADLAARRGQRDEAIRILGSVVDVRPGDINSQKRLARLHRWAGRSAVGCRHAIAIAQLRQGDAKLLADAVFCGRKTGANTMVEDMLASADDKVRGQAKRLLDGMKDKVDAVRGEVRVTATWEGGHADLDIGLVHPDGHRVSWLGAPTKALISAEDVGSTRREALGLLGSKAGEYAIEIVRASGEGTIRGEVVIRAAGNTRTVPFTLTGERATVGTMRIFWRSRLVPM